MQKEIRLGLVGYGGRGRTLLRLATQGFPGVTAAGLCDADAARLAEARQDFPAAALFHSYERMLDAAGLDAVLVETPASIHAELCCKALARNLHVLSDVPAVMSLEEARALWKAQQSSRALYMLGANPNTWGFVDAAVDLVARGALGAPYYMEAEYIHDLGDLFETTPWRKTFESIRYCTHSLGPLLRLIDEDLEWVSCFDTGSHIHRETGRHDAMAALFRTRSNVVVRLLVSFINHHPCSFHAYRVYGTKGYFEHLPGYQAAHPERTLFHSSVEHAEKTWEEIPEGRMPRDAQEALAGADGGKALLMEHGGADYALLRRLFTAIREGLPSPIPLREALRMSLPGIAAADSARAGGQLTRIVYPWSEGGAED